MSNLKVQEMGNVGFQKEVEAAKQEVAILREHYEKQLEQGKLERNELAARCRENEQGVERVKIEGSRQVHHYKQKYTEYKNKMRKANQNIAVLMARLAKFDL